MKLSIASSIILFSLLLSGCFAQPVATQDPILNVKATDTSLQIATPTINLTFKPSPTSSSRQLTQTAVHPTVVVIQQTQEHYLSTAVPATLEARNARCKDGFGLEQASDIIRYSNEEWTLFTCSPRVKTPGNSWTPGVVDFGTRYTQIVKIDSSKTWTILHNTFDYSVINRPDAKLVPYRWTADGNFLYLYPASVPSPSGFPQSAAIQTYMSSLYRINLQTGNFELVLRGDEFGALELSPNGRLLAYSEQDEPDIIHIRNMENGEDQQVKLNEDIIASGGFVWNANSQKVVFAIGYRKESEDWQNNLAATSIYVLTPEYMHAQKILARDARTFIPYPCFDNDYWSDPKTMCLYSINEDLDSWNSFFSINIETGEITYVRHY